MNGTSWAVKCFTTSIPDQRDRYAAISAHLSRARLSHFVAFDYQPAGIRIGKESFPILKMQWVSGEPLVRYIEKFLSDPGRILRLADRWLQMIVDLQAAGISHGDLQHGNIIVEGEEPRLVDYDGMYVPSLTGRPSAEIGHRNYQHPLRKHQRFGPTLDHFAAWSIYFSLVAIASEPSLWQQLNGGDDCLLLRGKDYEAPHLSDAFARFNRSSNHAVRLLAERIRWMLALDPEDVPPLSADVATPTPEHGRKAIGGWLTPPPPRHSIAAAATDTTGAADVLNDPEPPWYADQPVPGPLIPTDAVFVSPTLALSVSFWVGLLLAVGAAVVFSIQGIHAGPATATVVSLFVASWLGAAWERFSHREPGVLAYAQAKKDRYDAALRFQDAEKELTRSQREVSLIVARYSTQRQFLATKESSVREEYKRKLDAVDQLLMTQQTELASRRWKEQTECKEQSRAFRERLGRQIAALESELRDLNAAMSRESETALELHKKKFVDAVLRSEAIQDAEIPLVGSGLVAELSRAGIRTAHDVDPARIARVRGFGEARVKSICNWRRIVEIGAQLRAPNSLPDPLISEMAIKYAGRRRRLDETLAARRSELMTEEQAITSRLSTLDAQGVSEEARIKREACGKRDELQRMLQQGLDAIASERVKLDRSERDESELPNKAVRTALRSHARARFALEHAVSRYQAYSSLSFGSFLGRAILGD